MQLILDRRNSPYVSRREVLLEDKILTLRDLKRLEGVFTSLCASTFIKCSVEKNSVSLENFKYRCIIKSLDEELLNEILKTIVFREKIFTEYLFLKILTCDICIIYLTEEEKRIEFKLDEISRRKKLCYE